MSNQHAHYSPLAEQFRVHLSCAQLGRWEAADAHTFLKDHNPDPNTLYEDSGWRPLHYAANCCRPYLLKSLLDRGADPSIPSKDGRLPLHLAVASRGHGKGELVQAVESLLDAFPGAINCRKRTKTDDGKTPLQMALSNIAVEKECIDLLLKRGASVRELTQAERNKLQKIMGDPGPAQSHSDYVRDRSLTTRER